MGVYWSYETDEEIQNNVRKLQEEFKDKINVTEVNVDDGIPEIYQNLNIMSTPTVLFFKDDMLLDRFSGVKSYDDIKLIVNKLLEGGK